MPSITRDAIDGLLAGDDLDLPPARPAREPARRNPAAEPAPSRPRTRRHENATFKCGRCRAFVGPTVFGGRHRNHCPFCLTSRHVDLRRPGDRENPCRALMAPVGTAYRRDGEQVVVHRCNGCDAIRRCRVAADDAPEALLRLPLWAEEAGAAVFEEEAGAA